MPNPGSAARVLTLTLFASVAVSSLWDGCAASQPSELDKELEAAKVDAAKRKAAECYPGTKEPCYAGPANTAGRGVCKEGERACSPEGFWLECKDEALPAAAELCNDVDDDCDGKVDNGFQRIGTKCSAGQGECLVEGKYACTKDGSANTCSATAKAAADEICDGKDNDCDGQIDDGELKGTGAECATGQKGVCKIGHRKCQAAAIACVPDKQPSVEICNSFDDDCDGKTDEDCISEEDARNAGIK